MLIFLELINQTCAIFLQHKVEKRDQVSMQQSGDTLNQILEWIVGAEKNDAKTNIVSEIIGCGASSQPALKSDNNKKYN